jgi:hypothetical protein
MLFADNLLIYFVRLIWRWIVLIRSSRWLKISATVLSAYEESGVSWATANVLYEYAVGNQKFFSGTFAKPFLFSDSAKAYAAKHTKGKSFGIRVKPGQPVVSVADASVETWLP